MQVESQKNKLLFLWLLKLLRQIFIHSFLGKKGNTMLGIFSIFVKQNTGAEPATSGPKEHKLFSMWVRGTLGKFTTYQWKIKFRKLQWGHFLRCWSPEPSNVCLGTNRSLTGAQTGHCSHSCHWHFPNSRSQTCLNVCPLFLPLCFYPAATIQ